MKVFIVLAACMVSVASAGQLGGALYGGHAGTISTGQSTHFRDSDSYGNYRFGYDESHASGGSGRREERRGDVVTGSYNLAVQDGRTRRIDYIADKNGFRATVHTNEQGVDASRDPAAVLINKEGSPAVPVDEAPVASYGAPLGSFSAPVSSFGAPLGSFGAQLNSFGAPLNSFGAPFAGQASNYASAPLAHFSAAPLQAPAPVYSALAGPRQVFSEQAAPIAAAAPSQFSYSFGTDHAAPAQYSAQAPVAQYAAPAAAPAQLAYASPAPFSAHQLRFSSATPLAAAQQYAVSKY